jgi:hypothetical protein
MKLLITALACSASSLLFAQEALDTISYSTYPEMAQYEINSIKENFKNATNPLIATYTGSEMHDYFYFPFKDNKGNYYDFAYRNNNLCSIPFGDFDAPLEGFDASENNSPGSKLVGRKFLITWEYALSYIVCCEGASHSYPALLPRISSIEYYTE